MRRGAFGGLLRHYRSERGLTQLALAVRVETTTRHLSYVENDRSRPGRDLVLRLADALDLPLRARNDLLVAAGLAPEFPTRPLESAALAPYRRALDGLIGMFDPFPAFVIDPLFRIVQVNDAGRRMLPAGSEGELNLLDTFLSPGPARAGIENFPEVAWALSARFSRTTASFHETGELAALRKRVARNLAHVPRPKSDSLGDPVLCPTFRVGDQTVRTIGMTMRFGPSRDVTLEELAIDVLYPRDEAADRFFRQMAIEHAHTR